MMRDAISNKNDHKWTQINFLFNIMDIVRMCVSLKINGLCESSLRAAPIGGRGGAFLIGMAIGGGGRKMRSALYPLYQSITKYQNLLRGTYLT